MDHQFRLYFQAGTLTGSTATGYEKSHLLAWQTAPGEWVWQLEAQGSNSTAVTLPYDWRREGFTYDRPQGQGNCVMVREVAPSTRD